MLCGIVSSGFTASIGLLLLMSLFDLLLFDISLVFNLWFHSAFVKHILFITLGKLFPIAKPSNFSLSDLFTK